MNGRGKPAEARQPVSGCRSLPILPASVLALEDFGRRDADGVEVETLNTGDRASIECVNDGRLAYPGAASDDEYARHGDSGWGSRNPSQLRSSVRLGDSR